ncbi:MAG: N-terminal C2 domain-containing protein [Halobacteriovoraceae bacterium]|nr:N-terminal C2 domain-containing protein [Halobacteriovoraceae bacterium]
MRILFLVFCTLMTSTFARRGQPDTEADYIVPTPPQFVAFSRFQVKIVDRFEGPHTQKISYIFPEFIVGQPDKLITLNRVPNTKNSWTSPEINAHCAVIGDEFSCNIYVNKKQPSLEDKDQNTLLITAEQALSNLPRLNLSEEQLKGFTGVIQSFYSHEPAGFLTYDID